MQKLDVSGFSGLEGKRHIFRVPGNETWTNVPILNWNRTNRKVNLNASRDDNRNWNYALPVHRDCSNHRGPTL